MRSLYLVLVLLFFFGCKQENNTKKEENNKTQFTAGCYGYAEDGTSITFRITRIDPLVQGTLIYDWAEKDRNSGSFEGILENGKIIGTYTFLSEGIQSTREVVFKIKENELVEGYGEVTSMGNKVTFNDKSTLDFSKSLPLTLGECSN